MRIGILTHPLWDNYGGILQAWALQQVLLRRGHKVETFCITSGRSSLPRMVLIGIKRLFLNMKEHGDVPAFYELNKYLHDKKTDSQLLRFIKNNIHLHRIPSAKRIPEDLYDALIVGSDQVWRKKYINNLVCQTNDISDAFFYNIKKDIIRIAYSASFGVDIWEYDKSETKKIKEALSRFSGVSVRELSGIDLLKNNVEYSAVAVLDPTMLLGKEDYIKLIKDSSFTPNLDAPTVVSYILDKSKFKASLIRDVCSSRQIKNIELKKDTSDGIKLSIAEWLYYITNASIVITDSFHGCVFSIIFGKPLIFIKNEGRGNARFDTLIKHFGIENNLVTETTSFDLFKDYSLPKDLPEKISELRQKSLDFLFSNLQGSLDDNS